MLEKLPPSVGTALQNQRAGIEKTLFHRLHGERPLEPMHVQSPAFAPDHDIPARYTADGDGLSPPLVWTGSPEGASQVVVIVEDADSPTPQPLVHAIVVLGLAEGSALDEGDLNSPDHVGIGLRTGRNSYLAHAWLPPDPPPGHGVHRYLFQVFALRGSPVSDSPGRQALYEAVEQHGLSAGACVGTYERVERVRLDERAPAEVAADDLSAGALPA